MTDPSEPMPRRPSEPGPLEKRADFRAVLFRRLVLTLGGIVLVAVLVLLVTTVVVVRQTQLANTPTLTNAAAAAKAAKDSADRIADCTTPGRVCYERGQRQGQALGASVAQANAVAAAAAAACAVQMPKATFSQIYQCTTRNVDQASGHPKP